MPNKQYTGFLIHDRLINHNAGAGTNVLLRRIVEDDRQELIKRLSAVNKKSDFTKLRIGVWDGATFHVFEEHSNPTADTLYFTSDELIVREDMQLQVEFQGCTSGDDLEVFIQGVREERATKQA